MARLHDSRGRLLGGLNAIPVPSPDPSPESRLAPGLPPKYGPEETIPSLVCSYGALAYSYSETPLDMGSAFTQSHRRRCHNPVETPDERHHCDGCGGDYCTVHAEPVAHDCAAIIPTA